MRRRRLLHRTCVTIGSAIVASKQRATWRSEASKTLLQLRLRLISQRLRPRCSAALLGLLLRLRLLLRSSRHHRETSELMTIASCERHGPGSRRPIDAIAAWSSSESSESVNIIGQIDVACSRVQIRQQARVARTQQGTFKCPARVVTRERGWKAPA